MLAAWLENENGMSSKKKKKKKKKKKNESSLLGKTWLSKGL